MKILIVTHGIFLDQDRVAAGNSVRAYYLAKGLVESGHEVTYVYPQALESNEFCCSQADLPVQIRGYKDQAHLAGLIQKVKPDFILVGYWELLEQIPEDIGIPLILDLVAPRILEALFQPDRDLTDEIRKMLSLYRRADLFLVGNERQRHFLLPWLIMAGFDCRWNIPIGIIPISTEPSRLVREKLSGSELCFVSGGVSWPWRKTDDWFDRIVESLNHYGVKRGKLVLFQGRYIYSEDPDGKVSSPGQENGVNAVREIHPLLPYNEMRRFLAGSAHIGIELADHNVEREFSQSFRAAEFLRAGLPVICNDYLEISRLIREYDAGWVISSPAELKGLIKSILDDSDVLKTKSANALRLCDEKLNYLRNIKPVLDFIENPTTPAKGTLITGNPGLEQDLKKSGVSVRKNGSAGGFIKSGILSAARRLAGRVTRSSRGGTGVIMVSRGDIFPPDHGAAVKIDRTAAALSRIIDQVCLVTDDRRQYFVYSNGKIETRQYPLWIRFIAPSRFLVRRRLRKKGIPQSDAFLYYPLYDWSFIVRTLYVGFRHPARVFQAEFPAYARPCIWGRSIFGGQVVLAEHNVEYQRLRDQVQDLSSEAFEYLRSVELMLCRQADHVVVVSENDKNILVRDGIDPRRVHYIPHGLDLDRFDNSSAQDIRGRYGVNPDETLLVYHGTYLYPPNLEAVMIIAERILPILRKKGIRAKLLAVGPHPPDNPSWEDVTFTGSVENVAPYLKSADVAVVPLLRGGGTRMKILDYFAAGIPVVSTAKGIEGINAVRDKHAVIVEEADDKFASAIVELLKDPDRASEMGKNGRLFAEELDWKIIGRKYSEIMGL